MCTYAYRSTYRSPVPMRAAFEINRLLVFYIPLPNTHMPYQFVQICDTCRGFVKAENCGGFRILGIFVNVKPARLKYFFLRLFQEC
ncbi:hypothetical protein PUN28_004566 [Cardiocondyla obscurior]|uniref:Uncharacterized protein n=1 Tax=Cardiocondyla obscurior TaxID=286306 RepID=A0AAW2GDA9_9HYME